jgi:hypothetical protein
MPSPYIHLFVVKSDKLPEWAATEWGYGAVVQDPDGRKVELMQRNSARQ